jgi:hypothetical protein
MASEDDEDELERTMTSEVDPLIDPTGEIRAVLDELETLLKNGDVISALSARNVNASLALLAIEGLRAYLAGKKGEAADDFATTAEEIRARLAVTERAGRS